MTNTLGLPNIDGDNTISIENRTGTVDLDPEGVVNGAPPLVNLTAGLTLSLLCFISSMVVM